MSSQDQTHPSSLSAYWMPFTANRNFKTAPRMLVSAEGMHYRDDAGNSILDGTAGLWCVPLGHAHPKIVS
ncbi:aspartate aminotransferase family protein, partial [Acinetobacter baumannii]